MTCGCAWVDEPVPRCRSSGGRRRAQSRTVTTPASTDHSFVLVLLAGEDSATSARFSPRPNAPTWRQTDGVTPDLADDDRVPPGVVLDLDEAFRVLEALKDARLTLREAQAALELQDELATVIRLLHGRLGLDEGGVQ